MPKSIKMGAPKWPPYPQTFGPSRRSRDGPLVASGGLWRGRSVAYQGGAAHVAGLVGGERARPMHRLAVVPHDEVADAPGVGVDELPLGGVLDEVAQEEARLRHRPAHDRAGVRGEVERLALRHRVRAHQGLAHGLEAGALLVGEVGEAELLAREDLRM